MRQLFFDKKESAYFLVVSEDDILKCDNCSKVIPYQESMFIHRSFDKKVYKKFNLCLNCVKGVRMRLYDEFINAEVSLIAPENSIIVPEYKPGLQTTKHQDVFGVADTNEPGCEIINNCKVSFDSNRNIMPGALEHKAKVLERIKKQDREATMDDLKDIFKQQPIIEHKKVKQLKNEP